MGVAVLGGRSAAHRALVGTSPRRTGKKKHSHVFWEHTSSVLLFLVVIPITTLGYLFVKSKQLSQQDEARGQEWVRAAAAAKRLAGSGAGPWGFTQALLVRLGGAWETEVQESPVGVCCWRTWLLRAAGAVQQ